MISRLANISKSALVFWLGLSVLAAGFLTHLPELHADLHGHSHDSAQFADQDGSDHRDSEPGPTDEHSCLIKLFQNGCVDGHVAPFGLTVVVAPAGETPVLEPERLSRQFFHASASSRAPPLS